MWGCKNHLKRCYRSSPQTNMTDSPSYMGRIPFVSFVLLMTVVNHLLFNNFANGLIIEVYVNSTNANNNNLRTRRTTGLSASSLTDPTNATGGENYDDDNWQTTYDADVTIIPGTPLLNLSSIQFVLVGIEQDQSAASLSASNSLNQKNNKAYTTTTTLITRQIETYFKGTATFRRTIVSNRKETIWHGSLREPTNVTVTDESKNKNVVRQWRQQLSNKRRKKRKKENTVYRTGFCTVLEINGLIRSATFTTESNLYDLIYLYDTQQYQIRASSWGDFPPELAIQPEALVNTNNNYKNKNNNNRRIADEENKLPVNYLKSEDVSQDRYSNNTDFDPLERYITVSLHPITDVEITVDGPMKVTTHDGTPTSRRTQTATPWTTVDVLVVVTNRALCEFIGQYNNDTIKSCPINATNRAPMDNRLKIVEADTNNALQTINTQVRFVQVVYFPPESTYDPIADTDGINSIVDNTDIQTVRTATYADLVAVVAGRGGNCGVATLGGYRTVTNHLCLAQYTMSHEIGHNFKGNHNREVMNITNTSHPYAYAYRKEYQYRTFLSYECTTTPRCPRIPYYSSAVLTLSDGRILGNASNDNLRMFQIQGPVLAKFKILSTPRPTTNPTNKPTRKPTRPPTNRPTRRPTRVPTRRPTRRPTNVPTRKPTRRPTSVPTNRPINKPTTSPTNKPTSSPTLRPTNRPTTKPTVHPTSKPTISNRPSTLPSAAPSVHPTISSRPSKIPSYQPSRQPSSQPSYRPSSQPSHQPSHQPSRQPSHQPSRQPSRQPSHQPSRQPSPQPSSHPSAQPSHHPSAQPSNIPSISPTVRLTTCFDSCKHGSANLMYRKSILWAVTKKCTVRCVDEKNYQVYAMLGFRCGSACTRQG